MPVNIEVVERRKRRLTKIGITHTQFELMQHACGTNSSDPFGRNCFVATPGSQYDKMLENLVDSGFVVSLPTSDDVWPDRVYMVTEKGIALLKTIDLEFNLEWKPEGGQDG